MQRRLDLEQLDATLQPQVPSDQLRADEPMGRQVKDEVAVLDLGLPSRLLLATPDTGKRKAAPPKPPRDALTHGTLPNAFTMGAVGIAALIANAASFGLLWAYRSGDA